MSLPVSGATFWAAGARLYRRALPWAMMALLVLVGHALLLGLVPWGLGEGHKGGVAAPMQARRILLPPPPTAPAAAMPTIVATAAAATPVAPAPAAPTRAPAPAPAPAPAQAASAAPSEQAPAAPSEPASGGGSSVPVYATRMPPGAVLEYEMRRGALTGRAELVWRPRPDGYGLSLEGTAFAQPLIAWVSQGGFDAAGLAPERFVDQRRKRDTRAANFQRDRGLITFSGPSIEYPLLPGAQDRLSWMVQLAAIVQADAVRFAPGSSITLFVAGARGDADIWTFDIDAEESLDLPGAHVDRALHLKREPRRRYDTLVEVWLDPLRHHLPVRVRLAVPQTGDATDFLLVRMTLLP